MTKSNHKSDSDKNRIYLGDTTFERQFLRDVILYGCYNSRDYMDRQGLFHHLTSGRTDGNITKTGLNNEKHRLNAFLPEGTLLQDEHGNYVCNYDVLNGKDHPLLFSYCMGSCEISYTSAFIQIQSYLNRKGPARACDISEDIGGSIRKNDKEISRPALRKSLERLTEAGFLKKDKHVYAEADDVLEGFSEKQLIKILRVLDLAVNTSSFCAPYYFAWRKIRLYLVARNYQKVLKKWEEKRKNGIYKQRPKMNYTWLNDQEMQIPYMDFPRKHIFSQLDQDQIYQILRAIHGHQVIKIVLFNRDRYGSDETEIVTKKILPVHIREDAWTGRMLVQCLDPEDYSLHQYRIDYINRVETVEKKKKDDPKKDEDQDISVDRLFDMAHDSFGTYQRYIWSTSENVPDFKNGFQKVKVRFHVHPDTEYVIDRVEREKLNGEGRQLDENTYEYVFEATDPNDMSAWLRSFGESVEVMEPVDLRNKIRIQWTNAEEQMNDEKEFKIDRKEGYFNGNDIRKKADTNKQKDGDVTIAAPYENIRNEVATACWYTAYNQYGVLFSYQLKGDIPDALTPEGSPLRENLDIGELKFEGGTDSDGTGAGYLFRNREGNYKDDWILNLYIKKYYGDMPIRLSVLEREGLLALLRQEKIYEPLLGRTLFRKLEKAIGDSGMSWDPNDIGLVQNCGSYAAGKPDWKKIRKLKTAIKEGICISFHYQPVFSDQYDASLEQRGYPVRLEYFPGGNRVRVVIYMKESEVFTYMMVERMSDIHEAPASDTEASDPDRETQDSDEETPDEKYSEFIGKQERQLIMKIKPVSFALERIVRLFSYYHKKMVFDPDTSIYTMTLTYRKSDEEAVVRDILSCGDFVKVEGNPQLRDKVLARIHDAKNNYH